MTAIRNHEDLIFWQLSEKLRQRVFAFTARPQVAAHLDFCDDIRRASRRAPAVISEGFYRFRPRDNANYVRMALGSLGETKNHLKEALKENYIDLVEFRACWRLAVRAVAAGNGYRRYLLKCNPEGPQPSFDPSPTRTRKDDRDRKTVEAIELGDDDPWPAASLRQNREPVEPEEPPEPSPVEPLEPLEPLRQRFE